MWTRIAHFILKFRLPLIIALGVITLLMANLAQKIEISFDFSKVVPEDDPEMVFFQQFKDMYGEDGDLMVIGVNDSALFTTQNFLKFKYLSEEIGKIDGVSQVISLPLMPYMVKNEIEKKFDLLPIFDDVPEDQASLDSILAFALEQRIFADQLINAKNGATVIVAGIKKEILNSKSRNQVVEDVIKVSDDFSRVTGIELHHSGLPFVRAVISGNLAEELKMFLGLSVAVTAIILLFFFRSIRTIIFPIIMIGMVVVWSMGFLVLFGYKITLLTALLPPIIVVIGIPNSVYLLNKYHQEFARHGNKVMALSRIVRKIGLVTLITNFTTAIGFLVLTFTDIIILKEFGLIASLSVFSTFIVSIIFIPSVYSYLPEPNLKQLKHLQFKPLDKVLTSFDLVVHRHKYRIFAVAGLICLLAIFGVSKLQSVSYMVDDIPEDSKVKQDLNWFEKNFSGVMPLEIIVDTQKNKGVMRIENLRKIDELEQYLATHENIAQPISMLNLVKAANQAFYNGSAAFYELPSNRDRPFILRYMQQDEGRLGYMNSFVDSTGQTLRMSLKVADMGSLRMDSLVHGVIEPDLEEMFADSDLTVNITGTTLLFIKGNKFLVENLRMSLILAFIIIAIIMGLLFGNFRMILISLIPNFIPLLITAGVMGYFGIPLKPSTALIFSIAFGISVDDSIHFLAKYRQELFANNFFVPIAVSRSLRETGASMIYTSIILFFGFVIFTGSQFGGTQALGYLTSLTLLLAMFTNLIVLPALLLAFDSGKRKGDFHPLIEHYDEFYIEEEDEEIDLGKLEIQNIQSEQDSDDTNSEKEKIKE